MSARTLPSFPHISWTHAAWTAGGVALFVILFVIPGCGGDANGGGTPPATSADLTQQNATALIDEGRATFRFDTFGDEAFWGDTLRLHQAIAGVDNGGVGPGMSPRLALALGLKVDSEALGEDLRTAIASNQVDLSIPATTIELLRRDAVVGVRGFFDAGGQLASIGIQCALCHSTVDDSFAPGMGLRRDGWPNRDLDIGAIAALAPNLAPVAQLLQTDEATVRTVLESWGPGKFDAQLLLDGKAFQPNGASAATLIPPALGMLGVNMHTWTGWGSVTYWNAFVANIEMHGKGNFYDPRLADARKFPIAAKAGFDSIESTEDLITGKLAALQFYQLALPIPTPPAGSFDAVAAERGEEVFNGQAGCKRCHVPPLYTEPGWNMHDPSELGIDDFQASRSPDEKLRTAPLRAMFLRDRGGYYHDGRFATLLDVVDHYDAHMSLALTPMQKSDLVEFLKSL
jgi:hypothetical protein